ncbi:GTP-binding protein Ras-like protein [Euroglyphus maynei]|uniref:GTP-binding protein Ras-like protein n=1 Tax=Euroglyphus maynei TaxID=6958 RepID=A0A1Y3BES3_EURMA|nr:GTP-binding protein Ras-like protein [Euroglyphus maynei]
MFLMVFQEVPIVFVGNKQDLDCEHKRIVQKEDVAEWIFCELPKLRAKLMECSAKNNQNIKEIFLTFQQLARIPMQDAEGLKRRSSAQARVDSKRKFAGTNLLSPSHATTNNNDNSNSNSTNITPNPTAPNTPSKLRSSSSSKPRSRSLIRRTSKKVKNKEDADDCSVQ